MKNNEILRIGWFLLNLNATGRYTTFFDYSGHVKVLCIRIFKGKWSEKKKPIYEKSLNLKGETPFDVFDNTSFSISEFIEYVKELSNSTKRSKQNL